MMNSYYPECDEPMFFKDMPLEQFTSDEAAIAHYEQKYGNLLMAVIKDNDPDIEVVYSRGR